MRTGVKRSGIKVNSAGQSASAGAENHAGDYEARGRTPHSKPALARASLTDLHLSSPGEQHRDFWSKSRVRVISKIRRPNWAGCCCGSE